MRFKLVTGKAGKTIVASVPVRGLPFPGVEWLKEDEPLQQTSRVNAEILDNCAVLTIRESKLIDSANYFLVLTNKAGTLKAKVEIRVLDCPDKPSGPIEFKDVT